MQRDLHSQQFGVRIPEQPTSSSTEPNTDYESSCQVACLSLDQERKVVALLRDRERDYRSQKEAIQVHDLRQAVQPAVKCEASLAFAPGFAPV